MNHLHVEKKVRESTSEQCYKLKEQENSPGRKYISPPENYHTARPSRVTVYCSIGLIWYLQYHLTTNCPFPGFRFPSTENFPLSLSPPLGITPLIKTNIQYLSSVRILI